MSEPLCIHCKDPDASLFYTVRCLDRRSVGVDGTDESGMIEHCKWPLTGVCETCARRSPLPAWVYGDAEVAP